MNALPTPPPRPKLAGTAIAAFCFSGMAAIAGWSLPEAGPVDHRPELAMRVPDGEVSNTADEPPASVRVTRNAPPRANCEGCGVIESVRRIDTREVMMESCAVGDTAGTRIPRNLVDGGDRNDLATLAETVAGVIVGDHRAKKVRVTTRHQIVVRFRDGSRHVFNEDTPRTLHEGERIKVIAGSTGVNG